MIRRRSGSITCSGLIARGGMAEVYRARRRVDRGAGCSRSRSCARSSRREARFIDMFNREGQLAMMLRNRCIVETDELGQHDGRHYIAMEYIGGRDSDAGPAPLPGDAAADPGPARGVHRRADRRGPPLRAHAGRRGRPPAQHRQPRRVAVERAALVRRRRQAARLRHRAGADEVHERDRHPQGQVQLHVPRADPRHAARRAHRRVLGRGSSSTRC